MHLEEVETGRLVHGSQDLRSAAELGLSLAFSLWELRSDSAPCCLWHSRLESSADVIALASSLANTERSGWLQREPCVLYSVHAEWAILLSEVFASRERQGGWRSRVCSLSDALCPVPLSVERRINLKIDDLLYWMCLWSFTPPKAEQAAYGAMVADRLHKGKLF